MASYGSSKEKVTEEVKKGLPPIKLSSVLFGPWVLVPEGSLLGFFDWVPRHLRVGKWSPLAAPLLISLSSVLIYICPDGGGESKFNHEAYFSIYPDLYSTHWWCSAAIFSFMLGLFLYLMTSRFKGIVATFTILSWILNTVRHGIHTIVPFLLQDGDGGGDDYAAYAYSLVRFNKVLRFPALASASITFTIWNAILVPYLYWMFDTSEKKRNFLAWNFTFRLTQIHVCNIIYALLNAIVLTGGGNGSGIVSIKEEGSGSSSLLLPPPHLFDEEDLWYGSTYGFVYGLFYVLVLDRIGVHIYPIFSPRSNLVVLTWLGVFLAYFGCFRFWNHVMETFHDVEGRTVGEGYREPLCLWTLLCVNIVIMGCCGTIHLLLTRLNKSSNISSS